MSDSLNALIYGRSWASRRETALLDLFSMLYIAFFSPRLARSVAAATLALITLMLTAPIASAQTVLFPGTSLNFSGYVMEMPIYENIQPTLAQLTNLSRSGFDNLIRLRLRPTLHIGDNTKIGLAYEIDCLGYSKNVSFGLASTTPLRQVISLHWQPIDRNHITLSDYIDRLYFDQEFSFGTLVIGRQRISWGTGRVWNPTDIFNPINPANFGKIEKDGADAASMKFYLGQLTDLQLVYNAEYHFNSSNYAARFRTNILGYDLAVLAGSLDRRLITGGDFAGNVWTAGIRGEALVSQDPSKQGGYYVRWILGMDYQFTDKLYGLFEYYHNGQGTLDRSRYDLIGLYEGRILNLAKDYLALSGSYQLTPLVTVMLSSISNFSDGSGYLAGTVNYSASDNASIAVGSLYAYGKTFTEYWYYPQAYYVKVETY
ncbi:MAG: hypothetical protein M1378_01240, partial [Bacteroidetes bacterium]|nr:hypothetical protein [Bacteroidota bacterium]